MLAIRIAALAVLATACTTLDDVNRDVCGNGVIEPGNAEDCDGADGCGAPDSDQACRVLCDDATACPGTASCGLDGICHAPGGTFEVAASLAWTAPHLLVADTTADGYPELIGVGAQQVEVRLGGPDLGFSALPPIPSPALSGTPQVADLEGDGDADVLLPVGVGVFSLSGDPSTVLDPFFYNSFPAPANGRIIGGILDFADIILVPLIGARDDDSGQSVIVIPGDETTDVELFPAGRSVDDVVGELVVGTPIDGSPNVRTVALAFSTGRAIALYDVTLGAAIDIAARAAPVMLPLNSEVEYGVWFADFDGDGHQDLVASVDQAGVEALAVAWGRGDGVLADSLGIPNQASIVWRADRDQDADGTVDGALAPFVIGQVTDNVGVLGDENDADVVAAGGLYTTACVFRNQCALLLLRPSTRTWTGGIVGDVNGDDLPDVVAFNLEQTGLDILLNTPTTLLFNDASVATRGVVERLIPGDFNGDSLEDLAYIDSIAGVPYSDALSVSFGALLAPPSPPVFMGTIGEMVTGGELLSLGGSAIDYISDVVLVADREVDGELRRGAAIVFGSSARRLFAPLIPDEIDIEDREFQGSRVDQVLPLDANGDGFADVSILTTTGYGFSAGGINPNPIVVKHARFYTGQSDGQVIPAGNLQVDLTDDKLLRSRWIGADVAAGALDEAVGVLDDGALVIVLVDGSCTGEACMTMVAAPAAAIADPVTFQAVDADGDGDNDLLAVMRNRGSVVSSNETSVLIWWNEGGFTNARMQRFDGDIADAAVIDRERDGTPELVVLYRARAGSADGMGLRIATHTAGGFTELVPLADAADGVALRATDVNGDGLDDLVVVAGVEREVPRELTVYLQSEERIVP